MVPQSVQSLSELGLEQGTDRGTLSNLPIPVA
jgi:hypothetical protein